MNVRDRHVVNQAPDWSRPSQAFRHLDGRPADDCRHAKSTHIVRPPRRRPLMERVRQRIDLLARMVVHYFAPTPKQRLILGSVILGMAWGVMCAIGMMAAWGIHP
jgi:hypothetical protein